MEGKSRRTKRIITGGMILIALGVLIILHNTTAYGFSKSWPILLIVIGLGTVIQSVKDIGGWIIGAIGVLFFLTEMLGINISTLGIYILPLLLILLGISIIAKHYRKS